MEVKCRAGLMFGAHRKAPHFFGGLANNKSKLFSLPLNWKFPKTLFKSGNSGSETCLADLPFASAAFPTLPLEKPAPATAGTFFRFSAAGPGATARDGRGGRSLREEAAGETGKEGESPQAESQSGKRGSHLLRRFGFLNWKLLGKGKKVRRAWASKRTMWKGCLIPS